MACRSAADGRSKLARIHSLLLHRSQRIRIASAEMSPRSRCRSAGTYQRFRLHNGSASPMIHQLFIRQNGSF
jgi:hypothetical protein